MFSFSFKSLAIECIFRGASCLRVNILQSDIRDLFSILNLAARVKRLRYSVSRSCNYCLLVEDDLEAYSDEYNPLVCAESLFLFRL